MHRSVRARIDLSALRHNFAIARRHAGARAVWPVVKADAYGHGMLPVARALEAADGFCVADLDEALVLRHAGIDKPLLAIQGAHDGAGLRAAAAARVTLGVHDPAQLAVIERTGPSLAPSSLRLWLKLETGMHRLGLEPRAALSARDRLASMAAVAECGVMTHFACADSPAHPLTATQADVFARAAWVAIGPVSACNSAALLTGAFPGDSVVRPGIMLYGASPLLERSAADLGLLPVMSFDTRVIAVKALAAGETVGYGATWSAPAATRVAIVAAGYGDGYPRHAPSGTPVHIGGAEFTTVGRVSMDSLTVDLGPSTDAAQVQVGDAVTLWGDALAVDRIAAAAGTIGYDLLAGVTGRVPREYVDAPAAEQH